MDGKVHSQGHGNGFAFVRNLFTANWLMLSNQFLVCIHTAQQMEIFQSKQGDSNRTLAHDYELVSEVYLRLVNMLVSLGLSIFRWLLTSWSHLCTELSVDPAAYQHRFTPYFDGIKNQSTCPEIRRYVTDHTSDFFSSLAPGSTHDDRFSAAFFGSRLGARNFDPPSCYIKCFELILDTLNLILCARQKIVESYHV